MSYSQESPQPSKSDRINPELQYDDAGNPFICDTNGTWVPCSGFALVGNLSLTSGFRLSIYHAGLCLAPLSGLVAQPKVPLLVLMLTTAVQLNLLSHIPHEISLILQVFLFQRGELRAMWNILFSHLRIVQVHDTTASTIWKTWQHIRHIVISPVRSTHLVCSRQRQQSRRCGDVVARPRHHHHCRHLARSLHPPSVRPIHFDILR